MSLLIFQHEAHEPTARLGRVLQEHGHRMRVIELFDGQPIPPDLDDVDGVIAMGGSANVGETDQHAWIQQEIDYLKMAHDAGVPIVGVCLGAQLIAAALGGEVSPMAQPEIGWHPVKLGFPGTIDTLFAGIPWDTVQFHLHGQEVTRLPDGATPLSGSKQCRTQAFKVGLTTYAFQYHFEWDQRSLETVLERSALVKQAGVSADQVLAQNAQFYDAYARLGERLCQNIAIFLMPVDKR